MSPLLCKKPTLRLTTNNHIRYGFGLIQKDIHNTSTKDFPSLDKLIEQQSNKWNSMIKGNGNSSKAIGKAIQMIRKANYQTKMVVLAQAAQIPKASKHEMLNGPNYSQITSPSCVNKQTKLFAGMLKFNHVSSLISIKTYIMKIFK